MKNSFNLQKFHKNAVSSLFVVVLISCIINLGCSDSSKESPTNSSSEPESPSDYPDIPKPSSPLDLDQPMSSDTISYIVPLGDKNVDFVPVISDGTFKWNVDIQTQYTQDCFIGCPTGVTTIYLADPQGNYYDGTRKFSNMVFEGGIVNLRSLRDFTSRTGANNNNTGTQRIVFFEDGDIVTPRNPYRNDCWFIFWDHDNSSTTTDEDFYFRKRPSLFGGYVTLAVTPGFFDKAKWRKYYVSAVSCDTLTAPLFIKRDRYWVRVLIDGKKSIRVDPGNTFTVSYERKQGVSSSESESFARSLDLNLGGGYSGVTGSIGTTLTETFTTTIEVSEETTVGTERSVTGLEGKTVIYSVWRSVEEYTITDSLGNPYTDPAFSFSNLGGTKIQGEYEWLSSAIFDL